MNPPSAFVAERTDRAGWEALAQQLAAGKATLLSLWADPPLVQLAYYRHGDPRLRLARIEAAAGTFPSIARLHLPALRLERTIHDLFGLRAEGTPDTRPWLDHGTFPSAPPMAATGTPPTPSAYAFLPVEGEDLHEVPVGPVHAGIIEPGHFRFTASGEAVVRLEERLGYTHKGTQQLMRGATPERGARLAGRVSGDSTVAYAWAFARAVEEATGTTPPPRAIWLRALMAELERVANHFGDIGAICNDVAFAILNAYFGTLREQVLAVAADCFGHRLMMDRIVPGGVAGDLAPGRAAQLGELVRACRTAMAPLVRLYDDTASLQDRVARTGIVKKTLAAQYGAGGFVGRASGRDFDARRDFAYAPYDRLDFTVPVLQEGDVNARVWIRIREVEQSLSLIEQILAALPAGPIETPLAAAEAASEGLALVEGFRGEVLVWVRLDGARIAACHVRDPSWFQWPLLEAAIEGNIIADFPVCNKSFNCSYSGIDV